MDEALRQAAQTGNEGELRRLLLAGAPPDEPDADQPRRPNLKQIVAMAGEENLGDEPFGRTPLALAARAGHAPIVQQLLQAGADPLRPDFLGLTPLRLAAAKGRTECVRLLPGDLSAALQDALDGGHRETARLLLERGAKGKLAHLRAAAELADAGLLRQLLTKKAKLTGLLTQAAGAMHKVPKAEAPPGRWTQIFNADGHFMVVPCPDEQVAEAVTLLLEAGALPDQPGPLGTPLMAAARNGHVRTVQALLQAGADPNAVHDDTTALQWAEMGQQEATAALLRPLTQVTPARTPEEEREPAPDLPIPEFTPTPAFHAAVKALEEATSETATPLGSAMEVRATDFPTLQWQREWLPQGCYFFEPRDAGRVAVLPTARWQDALAHQQTNGANCDLAPSQVLAWLEDLEGRQPFVLRTLAHDLLVGEFLTPIADPAGLAEAMYAFCPDLVDQGCGTVDLLAEELRQHPAPLYFWWD